MCLIDDAQWLDVPSADALMFTARRLAAEGVVLLFAVREDDRGRLQMPGEEIVLDPLDREQAVALLEHVGREVASSVRERLLGEAAGNPLALLELPSGLSDEQLAGQTGLPDAIPLTARLQAAFQRRVEGMPADTRAALLLAAADGSGELQVLFQRPESWGCPLMRLTRPSRQDWSSSSGSDCPSATRWSARRSTNQPRSTTVGTRTPPWPRRALAETQTDRRVWHQAIATLTADEQIAAELKRPPTGLAHAADTRRPPPPTSGRRSSALRSRHARGA